MERERERERERADVPKREMDKRYGRINEIGYS